MSYKRQLHLRIYRALKRLYWRLFKGAPAPYIYEEETELVVYRGYDGVVTPLSPVEQPQSVELSRSLMQEAGYVKVEGQVYDLREDGVYRFYRLPDISMQRIVCGGDLQSALKMMGYLFVYSARDNIRPVDDLYRMLASKTVYAGCSPVSQVVSRILSDLGISNRKVACMKNARWNGHDDGHSFLEVKGDDGKWFAYDPSFSCVFKRDGKALSLSEIVSDKVSFEIAALSGHRTHGAYESSSYDYGFWVEERFLSEDRLLAWYNSIFDVPLIQEEGQYYYPKDHVSDDNAACFQYYYEALDKEKFKKKFYGE